MRIETGYQPRAHQRQIHRSLKRFSVLVCHRRFGKTVLAINALIDSACRCKLDAPRFAYLAPEYKQAKAVAWDYLQRYTEKIRGKEPNQSELWVELVNGARIRLFGADNPDSLRGQYWDGVVLDEVAQMRPEVWGEIVRPGLADRMGWALFIGTPKGLNLFSDLYHQALDDPAWYAGIFRASDTGIIPESELDEARKSMSAAQYAQEFECDFTAASEDTLIPLDLVLEATRRQYHESVYSHSPVILGVDVARFGDDRSVVVWRKGLITRVLHVLRDTDTMQLSGAIANAIDSEGAERAFIDMGAMGAGVYDRLRQLGYRQAVGVNFGGKASNEAKFPNKRSEMWCLMLEWLSDGGSLYGCSQEVIRDLVSLRYTYDPANRRRLESKDDAKKRGVSSPDIGDALALTFAFPVRVPNEMERAAEIHGRRKSYDPLTWTPGAR